MSGATVSTEEGTEGQRNTCRRLMVLLICAGVVGLGILAGVSWLLISGSRSNEHSLDIVASAGTNLGGGFTINGRVMDDENPCTNSSIWCIARDEAGNRNSPASVLTDSQGKFTITGIPATIGANAGNKPVSEIRIFARQKNPHWYGNTTERGEYFLSFNGYSRQANVINSSLWFATLICFGFSIFTGLFIDIVKIKWHRFLYFLSISSALALTYMTLWAIGSAYMQVKTTVAQGQTWSIGFISIFEGTYVKDHTNQWLLSLTGPPDIPLTSKSDAQVKPNNNTTQPPEPAPPIIGMGAPMWVVFLAVIGAALSILSVVVHHIIDPPNFEVKDLKNLRGKLLGLVQNQLFILFSPLGGIFVYQALVVGGAASQPIVVGIAALGAGATLNNLLALAMKKAAESLAPTKDQPSQKDNESSRDKASSTDESDNKVSSRPAMKPTEPPPPGLARP